MQSFNSSLPSSSQPNKVKLKYKVNKADRNTKTLIAKEIKGNRGDDNIDALLAFIENKEKTRKNGVISTNANNAGKQNSSGNGGGGGVLGGNEKNKKTKNGKKEGSSTSASHKLKKSNSMEELKSCSKLEDEIAQSVIENTVLLRHKGNHAQVVQSHSNSTVSATIVTVSKKNYLESKENHKQQQQQKRGERRSWGTEELSYLGENNCLNAPSTKDDDREPRKQLHPMTKEQIKPNTNKIREEHSLSIVSIESIPTNNETAEFHVVTKKKKAKKRQILEEARHQQMSHGRSGGGSANSANNNDQSQSHMNRSGGGNSNKYNTSQHYANDRDVYLAPFNTNDNRRKSTSSVPPSEKSDSSDLDSVHSLPVESTSARLLNLQQQQQQHSASSTSSGNTPQASYADIARISNPDKGLVASTPLDKWPTVSANKNLESPPDTISIISSSSSSNSCKSYGSARQQNKFFPESNDIPNNLHSNHIIHNDTSSCSSTSNNSTIVKQISYSQSLIDDKQQQSPPIVVQQSPPQSLHSHHDDIKQWPAAVAATSSTAIMIPVGITITNRVENVKLYEESTTTTLTMKNPLQKSKSVDNDNYNVKISIDHYPALEKTVKPQKQYQSLPVVETTKSTNTTIVSSTKQPINKSTSIVPPTPTSNQTIINQFQQQQQQQQPQLFINPTSKTQSTTTTPNAIPTDVLTGTTAVVNALKSLENSMKKPKQNISVSTTKPQQQQQSVINDRNSNLDKQNNEQSKSSKITNHNEGTVNSTSKKITKKDKNHYVAGSNRPAVIILNDNNSKYSDNVSPLLFGDFNDEVLRLLEQDSDPSYLATNHHFENENSIGTTSTSQSLSHKQQQHQQQHQLQNAISTDCDSLASPVSDLGYSSSSHNRCTLSNESVNKVSNTIINQSAADYPISTGDIASNRSITNCRNKHLVATTKSTTSKSCHSCEKSTSTTMTNEPINDINNSSSSSNSNSNSNMVNNNNSTLTEEILQQSSVIVTASGTNTTALSSPVSGAVSACVATNTEPQYWDATLMCEKELSVRFIAPPILPNMSSYNHDKIVNFVGLGKY